MGLINDVKQEVAGLDLTRKSLRKFGLTVGTVFLLLAWMAASKHWDETLRFGFLGLGGFLALGGALVPGWLRGVYRGWMAMSLAMGWCVSRVLLTILFYAAILPVAIMGRVFRLPFTKMRRPPAADSYWVERTPRDLRHHAQMY